MSTETYVQWCERNSIFHVWDYAAQEIAAAWLENVYVDYDNIVDLDGWWKHLREMAEYRIRRDKSLPPFQREVSRTREYPHELDPENPFCKD